MVVSSSVLPLGLSATGVDTVGIAAGGGISCFSGVSVGVGVVLSRYWGSGTEETDGVETEGWRQGPDRLSGVPLMTVVSRLLWKGRCVGLGEA